MTELLVRDQSLLTAPSLTPPSPREVFSCPEESRFYSYCLESLILGNGGEDELVVEFGSGEGSPVIHSLIRTPFAGTIHGYELNSSACAIAESRIKQHKLSHQYIIYNQSFFGASKPKAQSLIANPPYLPAIDNQICMPLLHGGADGAGITNQLLSLNYQRVMLMVSSYSNPVSTINCALANNYLVTDFLVSPLQFGYYSCEPKVKRTIANLRQKRQAFFSGNVYFLAGVLFQKRDPAIPDLSSELLQVMTSL